MCEKSVEIFWVNAVAAFAPFFSKREIFENGISWSIDWLFFVEISLRLELKIFEKKKWRLYWLRKKQVLRIMDWLKLNGTHNHKSNIVVVIVCWWWLFCFENRGRFDVVAFVFLKEERSSIPMQFFYRGFHIDWVFWVNTTYFFGDWWLFIIY